MSFTARMIGDEVLLRGDDDRDSRPLSGCGWKSRVASVTYAECVGVLAAQPRSLRRRRFVTIQQILTDWEDIPVRARRTRRPCR